MFDSLESRQFFSTSILQSPSSAGSVLNTFPATLTQAENGGFLTTINGGKYFTSSYPSKATVNSFKVSKTGTLFITGNAKADSFFLNVKNGKIVTSSEFATADSAVDLRSLPRIKRIVVETLGGNDRVSVTADVPVTARGAKGDDTFDIYAPQRTIVGGSGSNTIHEGDRLAASTVFGSNAYRITTGDDGQFSIFNGSQTIKIRRADEPAK